MLPDEKQREQALDPACSFIVQAPAGSGKTELLTQRFLGLLSTVSRPEEILAMTFTRKSAAEMRGRIIAALEQAATQPMPKTPHGQKTWQLARNVLRENEKRKWHLPENPERLRIQTIDAFNSTLTRQMPLLAGFGAPPDIATQPATLYRNAVLAVMTHLETDLPWSDAIATVLQHLDNSPAAMEALLIRLLERRDQWLPYIVWQQEESGLREILEEQLSRVTRDILEHIASLIPADRLAELITLSVYAADNLGNPASHSTPGTDPDDRAQWLTLRKLLLTDENEWRKAVNKNTGFPADNKPMKLRMQNLIAQLSDMPGLQNAFRELYTSPEPYFRDSQWAMLAALLQVLRVAVAELRLQFQQHGQIDYTENALAALNALGPEDEPTDLSLALDCRIRHLLVDEFQDTSATQFRLLEKLTAGWEPGDGRTLFLVGDPMQSIYRFREAEVGLFIRARTKGIGHLHPVFLRLSVNFRSAAGVVDWVNQHFPAVFPGFDDVATGAVSYSPGVAALPPGKESEPVRLIRGTRDASRQGQQIVELIKDRQKAAPTETIAILVRARTHLGSIIPCLREADISWSAIGIDPLYERPVIQDLISLTRALTNPADRTAWLAILRAPWCGLTLADLLVITGSAPLTPVPDLLAAKPALSAAGQTRLARILPVLQSRLQHRERFTLRYQIESAWLLLGGPACLSGQAELQDAAQFFRLLEQFQQKGIYPGSAQLDESVRTLYAAPDARTDNPVQIMTVHNAKGLEFDTVIIPHLEKIVSADKKELLLWMERPGISEETALLFAPVHAVGDESDSVYDYIRRENNVRNLNEQSRLLYVAVTRAKKNLCLLFDTDETRKPASGSLLASLWPAIENSLPTVSAASSPVTSPENTQNAPQQLKRLPLSFQNPVHETPIEDTLATHHDASGFILGDPAPRQTGTVIHTIIQHLCNAGKNVWQHDNQAWIKALLQQTGMHPEALDEAAVTVRKAIDTMLTDEKGQWIMHPHTDAASEFAVTTLSEGSPMALVIDRTFVDEGGTRWIIDFKTSCCTDRNISAFLQREEKKYRTQMLQYREAMQGLDTRPIRLGLYFPLLPQFTEIQIPEH